MNKTVNINLANTLFHIDDDAYNKLRRYLESIKRSFAGTKGSDEIIADIEARIAELFLEKMENERQVITHKEVDQVIDVMGQPEDYMVDEDIFEDDPKRTYAEPSPKAKKLYRDIDHKYIGGVCAGLEHYLGFDAIWIRIIFILLAVFTSGFGLIAYILLWILVPEAATTSQKLDMRGEPVNISNIERKVKEGFDDVADKVKNVDYEKVGNKVKSSSKTFFDTIGDIILFLFKVFGKFIGILLIIIGASTLIGLFFGLFTVGMFDAVHFPGVDFYEIVNTTGAPVWVVSLLMFFAIGIPFFFVLYLGLKILVNNLKSIGNIAKFTLLGLWLISVGALIALGIRQAAEFSNTGSVHEQDQLVLENVTDTIVIRMKNPGYEYTRDDIHFGRMSFAYDKDDNRVLISDEVDINVKKAEDSIVSLSIRKDSNGSSSRAARDRAKNIKYGYELSGNAIILDEYLITDVSNKARNQEVTTTIYIPEGRMVQFEESTRYHMGRGIANDKDYYRSSIVGHVWLMGKDGELKCQDCPDEDDDNERDGNGKIIINEDGIDINIKDNKDSFEMKINEDGIKVKAGN
ncbi:PspC domain-containing protein [Flagellimonas taeanensis]|jgi:phage shock protein PspC (stress-responsive transcriptional regulator)|uniref:PspC domain-containing protein n=1 Tax=Flavobacteriaceae TaxID=49546 RepID=UPI000E6A2701|nr:MULTISPECIES: PspC domain-containing protein [Allomuricauda]MDC6384749.1 PspC domain-containing protein [Muricauda sp. SK9]MEE1962667.1 PspC domain-containing protein [Allomuricauda taeanensis]RIV53511.1 PspC domain-containing protein [Allomuricauda taeanensis]